MSVAKIRGEFLEKRGTAGTVNANENYSGAVQIFEKVVPAGEIWNISRMVVLIEDGGSMSPDEYGNLGVALTNGIQVCVANSADVILSDLTTLLPVKTNSDWSAHCFDVSHTGIGTSGSDAYAVRWSFDRDHLHTDGQPEPLRLLGGQKFQVHLNDDLTGLTKHYFRIGALAEDLYP